MNSIYQRPLHCKITNNQYGQLPFTVLPMQSSKITEHDLKPQNGNVYTFVCHPFYWGRGPQTISDPLTMQSFFTVFSAAKTNTITFKSAED